VEFNEIKDALMILKAVRVIKLLDDLLLPLS
jgi:hypothetical protein